MKSLFPLFASAGILTFPFANPLSAEDARLGPPKTLNTLRSFPKIASLDEWKARASDIRAHAQISCGLWPFPEKTPLNPVITGKVEREGYSVEKVYFESYPGFFVAGNLYRPLGQGNGPFPAILNPHGHWNNGRFADEADGSIAARCINFAKQGMVAFSYDMVGYNDTRQVSHKFAANPTNELWQISLMGLQTWNSIRALDFLEALPEVDPKRLACTGESGGGTQTFLLGALDDRLAAQAPIVMVSHSMQGGCLCENAPGLRVKYSNMEIAAQPAPRPQIIVSATGDWTRDTMKVEGPNIQSIYKLFNADNAFEYHLFDYGHNYNKTSREAVYTAFGRWLLNNPATPKVEEVPYTKEKDEDLKVFSGSLPPAAKKEDELIQSLVTLARDQLKSHEPADAADFNKFYNTYHPAWKHSLQVEIISREDFQLKDRKDSSIDGFTRTAFKLSVPKTGQELPATLFLPKAIMEDVVIVALHPDGMRQFVSGEGNPQDLAALAVEHGLPVIAFDAFGTGALHKAGAPERNQQANYFSVYNKTDSQERVQDIAAICAFARTQFPSKKIVLWGSGRAGLWTLLAAPLADSIVADVAQVNDSLDEQLMAQDLFAPGLRRLGSFQGIAALAFPKPVLIHNVGNHFSYSFLQRLYQGTEKHKNAFQVETALGNNEIMMRSVLSLPKQK
ncbi:MAG: acetylxylan esterase [Verrucomicrobiales bacterium]